MQLLARFTIVSQWVEGHYFENMEYTVSQSPEIAI